MGKFSRRQIDDFFSDFCQESKFWHCMQIDSVHEMSEHVLREIIRNVFQSVVCWFFYTQNAARKLLFHNCIKTMLGLHID